jgi:lysophospholipase L1-like esterase
VERLFVIGDSISCYYGPALLQMLSGLFEVDRKGGTYRPDRIEDGTDGVNGGDSAMVLTYLRAVRRHGGLPADWVLLNCGLHDVKTSLVSRRRQVPPEAYAANLHEILDLLAGMTCQVVWVRTTPVKDVPPDAIPPDVCTTRYNADVEEYNAIADRVMTARAVPIVDLYSFTRNLGSAVYSDNHCHFTPETSALQAAFIAGALAALLPAGAREAETRSLLSKNGVPPAAGGRQRLPPDPLRGAT